MQAPASATESAVTRNPPKLLKGLKPTAYSIPSISGLTGDSSPMRAEHMNTPNMTHAPIRSLTNPAMQIFHVCFLQKAPFSGISPRLHLRTIRSIR